MVEEDITDQKREVVQCMGPIRHKLKNQDQISFSGDLLSLGGLHLEAGLVVDLEVLGLENNLS